MLFIQDGQREHFWVGGRWHPHELSADEIMTSSGFSLKWIQRQLRLFTAFIQHKVILVTELLWAACDEDVLISEEILKAHDLRLERENVISSIRSIRASDISLIIRFSILKPLLKSPNYRSSLSSSKKTNEMVWSWSPPRRLWRLYWAHL